jgi:hypothetical protein
MMNLHPWNRCQFILWLFDCLICNLYYIHNYRHAYIYTCMHVCMYIDGCMCACACARVSSFNGHFVAPP